MAKPIKISSDGSYIFFDEVPGVGTEELVSTLNPLIPFLVVTRKQAEIIKKLYPDIKLGVYESIKEVSPVSLGENPNRNYLRIGQKKK